MNPTIKKLLDSINTLGRELEKGSGSSAESASNKNVEAELLQRFRNSPGGSASAVNAAHSTVPCETSSTSTSLNKLTNAPRFALGYNFSKRQKRKDTSKTATGSFIKDVILLGGPEDDKVPRQGLRVLLSENNHIVSGATLRKEWGFPTVIDYLKSLFPSKLGEFDEITILMPVHSKLLEPNLPPGQQLSGFMIQKVFKDRPVYIRPHKRILTLDEYLPKKKRKLESASSDEDSGDDLNNKSTFEVTTGVTSNQAQTDMTISGNMIQ
ncbi:uncharacterized protein LOC110234590, partial [Exaiptasia diaphana]|uniref:Uncharacterized protein n=1 Tax=Exaiptasia diaphana TaxID=2652724 RepID=A0A913WXG9_EXADI